MATTARLALPYPAGTDGPDGADVPYWVEALAEALDGAAIYGQGILSSRPVSTSGTPGIAGRLYYVIGDSTTANNGILWLDYGTGWAQVNSAGVLLGNLADSPAANAVPAGTTYFAEDQVAEYLSDGTSWTRVSLAAGVTSICLGAAADEGHILLQGQAWPSTSGIYADLHAKLGGTTLPDLRGLAPVGYKSGDSDFGTLLATGGEKKHTLTIGEMPAHTHDVKVGVSAGGTPIVQGGSGAQTATAVAGALAGGGGLSHNNLPPFRVVNFQAKL